MLAALVAYLIFGGGGGAAGPMLYMEATAENIEIVVLAEERKVAALDTVELMLDRSKDHYKALDDIREQLGDVLERHDVTAMQLDALWEDYFGLDAAYSKDIIEMRFQLKDSLSREEWTAIFSSSSAETNKS